MAKLKLLVNELGDPKDSVLIVKETGEIIQRVKSVSFTCDIETGKSLVIITMYPIDIEVTEEL